jgi:UPF0271 protein
MIKINCDIGERGPDHPVDLELMNEIHIANIACGGHAGNEESVAVFQNLARENNIQVAAHLSYPDRGNFGRFSMDISHDRLRVSLDEQYALMPLEKMVKFHGALYNDSCVDPALAEALTGWLQANDVDRIITPSDSALARQCRRANIQVVAEAFAERRYTYTPTGDAIQLVNRSKAYACIHDCDQAVEQTLNIIKNKRIDVVKEGEGDTVSYESAPIEADTVCIHSDSDISLELAKKLAGITKP